MRDLIVSYAPRVLLAVVLLVLSWLASWALAVVIRNLGKRTGVHHVVVDLIAQVVGTAVLVIGIICVLGTLGVNVTALVAGLGLVGFAVGFALKDVLSNVLSGILLLYYRPFWIEDQIKVAGHEGAVSDIDLRYTTIHTDGSSVLLPNSKLFTESVEILNKKADNEVAPSVSARRADAEGSKSA